MDVPTARAVALITVALANAGQRAEPADLTAAAASLVPWILVVTTQLVPSADADGRPIAIPPGGTDMPLAVAATVDNTTVTLGLQPQDDHNDVTPDVLTWTNDDTGIVAAWEVSADTHSCVGTLNHVEGVVTVTVADPSATALPPFVFTVTVGPGGTSQMVGTATVV